MKANEIIINENVNLFEINMSPTSLRHLAGSIDAQVGMEFEMIVPTRFIKTNGTGGILKINRTLSAIGSTFSDAIGRPTNISARYHTAPRNPGEYAIEPDNSIDAETPSIESGLEFISPPLPIGEILGDLEKVREWASENNCYTNKSCGLHMNVSVPGLQANLKNLDYVKLVLLLGDKHILKQFGRLGNDFAKSSFNKVRDAAADNPSIANELLDQMKTRLSSLANTLTSQFIDQKFVSVHAKKGYIEFRSPGGDWLNAPPNQLENTLLRFVVALDAAMDPEKYRQEYLTKLYKLLQINVDPKDPISYFAKYVAGTITKEKLKVLLTNLRSGTQQPRASQSNSWAIIYDDVILTFVEANTPQVAKSQGFQWLHGKSIEWLNQHANGRMLVLRANDPLVRSLPRVADSL